MWFNGGGASVWKIGGKVFAIHTGLGEKDIHTLSFKCSDLNFQILCELENIIPAPYLARGKWVQILTEDAMSEGDIEDYINASFHIISKKLTRKLQTELGL